MKKLNNLERAELLREQLAALEHAQWCLWVNYMSKNKHEHKIWKKQAQTKYCDLSEKDKNGDREWADKVLKIISDYLSD